MQKISKITALILISVPFTQAAWAAEDLMTSHLVAQARHWQAKGREDFAAESWRSVLRSDPAHGEALIKLGLIEVKAGNPREASVLLDQATRVSPKPRGLTELSAALSKETPKTESVVPSNLKLSNSQTQTSTPAQVKESKPKTTSARKTSPASAPDPLLLKP